MTAISELRQAEAIALTQAELAFHSAKRGVRALFIKGFSTQHHQLRGPRVSADVDILVHPDDKPAAAQMLADLGWTERPSTLASSLFTTHSVALVREGWPCDVDFHTRFPGFLRDPGLVFDLLWSRRVTLEVGGVPTQIPDVTSAFAIAALHSLRDGETRPHVVTQTRDLVRRVESGDVALDTSDLVALTKDTGCVSTLLPILGKLSITVEPPRSETESNEYALWALRTTARKQNPHLWWKWVRSAPLRERPRLLFRAFWPSDHDVRLSHPELPDTRRALVWARMQRFGAAARALPSGLKSLRAIGRRP